MTFTQKMYTIVLPKHNVIPISVKLNAPPDYYYTQSFTEVNTFLRKGLVNIMGFYENVRESARKAGYSINKLEAELSLPRGSIAKYNISTPGVDKLIKIADFLGVSVDELCTGKKSHYTDSTAATLAQEAFESPEMRLLFDAAKGAPAEDILFAREFLLKLKEKSGNA